MPVNELPKSSGELFTLADDMAGGLHKYEAAIGVKQNTEVALRTALTAAVGAEGDFREATSTLNALEKSRGAADAAAAVFIKAARAVLVQSLGELWSDQWLATGFPNQSTAVPKRQPELLQLCAALHIYLAANPGKEIPQLGVTAAVAQARHDGLQAARHAVEEGMADAETKRNARDAAVAALRKRMRGLIAELEQLLDENAPEWAAFNLNAPGAVVTPEIPEGLTVTNLAAGMSQASWNPAARATRYRVWLQVAGRDEDFQPVATVHDTKARLTDLPTGATVNVRVTAANETGESQPGEMVMAVVG